MVLPLQKLFDPKTSIGLLEYISFSATVKPHLMK